MVQLTKAEKRIFDRHRTPIQIQDFLDTLKINFEKKGDTLRSPREVLRAREAHCIEGALLAGAILQHHGSIPLLLDLKADATDFDHVVALYKRGSYWGAISKSNHATLRFRDPIYKTVRELALSYFHEYFDNKTGKKTLVSYSMPFDVSRFGSQWLIDEAPLWDIGAALDDSPHYSLLPKGMKAHLRKADAMEKKAGSILEWNE